MFKRSCMFLRRNVRFSLFVFCLTLMIATLLVISLLLWRSSKNMEKLCGSMRFAKEMQEIAYDLETQKGYNILQCVYTVAGSKPTAEELQALELAHYHKIDISDGIYVLNINGYIGDSVHKEIEYALRNGKEVIYHCNDVGVKRVCGKLLDLPYSTLKILHNHFEI